MKLTRREDHAERLADLFKRSSGSSFIWGKRDCMLFVADCIEAATGYDLASQIRGTYWNEAGARKEIQRLAPSGDYVEYMEKIFDGWGGVVSGATDPGAVCIVGLFGQQFGGVITDRGVVLYQPGHFKVTGTQNIIKSWGFSWR